MRLLGTSQCLRPGAESDLDAKTRALASRQGCIRVCCLGFGLPSIRFGSKGHDAVIIQRLYRNLIAPYADPCSIVSAMT